MNEQLLFTKEHTKIESMKYAGNVARSVFSSVSSQLEPGITTGELAESIGRIIRNSHCEPTFEGYDPTGNNPFPAPCCISINEEVCHGIPGERKIGGGDLVSVDVGIRHQSYTIDVCRTFAVGGLSQEAQDLNFWTKTAVRRAIRHLKNGVCWQEVARIIAATAKKRKYGIVKIMNGHGIGKDLHEPPSLPNYPTNQNNDVILHTGQTICVEPMFALGSGEVEITDNKWTVVTKDKSLACHWEHCLLITDNSVDILA